MKFKGRILTILIVLLVNLLYSTFYYVRDGYVSSIEFIGYLVLLPLAWWFGKQYDKVQFYSEKDPLTGIYNRRYVEFLFPKLKETKERFAVLLIDVNDFKIINDLLGHKAGDEYLKNITNQLEKSVGKTDIVARWGGDEFIILSKSGQSKEIVSRMIEDVHSNLKRISTGEIEIGVSIGAALYPSEGKSLDELLKVADKKMYHRKAQNKFIIEAMDTFYYINREYPHFSKKCKKIDINVKFITFTSTQSATEVLTRRYYKMVYSFIYRITTDKELSFDLTQEVMIKMLKLVGGAYHPSKIIDCLFFP